MSTIKVLVNEQSLRVINGPKIASRGVNENVVEFEFDESWDGFGKTAMFYKEFHEENVYQSIIDSDGIASVPHEATDTECKMCFGVVGTKGNVIYTTEIVKYNIVKGVPISGSESEPPSPTIYQQMLSLVGQVQSDVDSFESDTNDRLDVMSSQMDEFIAEHAGTYGETVLWDSDNASGETISGNTKTVTLSEDCSGYDYIDIHFGDYVRTNTGVDFVGHTQTFFKPDYNNKEVQMYKWQFGPASDDPDGIHFKITYHDISWSWSGNAIDDAVNFGFSQLGWPIDKIVGRKLVADAELVDARVGVDGTVYQTVGAAIRGQINDVAGGTVELDTTLTQQGKAADAKAVGDKIGEIKADLSAINTATSDDVGKALKVKTVTNGKVTEWEFGAAGGSSGGLDAFAVEYPVNATWTQGYIKSDGTTGNDQKSCYTDYIESDGGDITVKMGSGYRSKVAHYNSSKTFVEMLYDASTDDKTISIPEGDYVRIQVSSDNYLTPQSATSVIAASKIMYTAMSYNKAVGKPADSYDVYTIIGNLLNTDSAEYTITSGYYSKANGNTYSNSLYAKTNKQSGLAGKVIHVVVGSDYKFTMRFWNGDTYDASKSTEYVQDGLFYVPTGWKVACNFMRVNGEAISSSDLTAIASSFHIYVASSGSAFADVVLGSTADFNDLTETGTYRAPSAYVASYIHCPTTDYGRLVVFNSASDGYSCVQIYVSYNNKVYTRILQVINTSTWSTWTMLGGGASGGDTGYLHDGDILRMASDPEAIPVGTEHLGYTAFMAATWETLLPSGYTDGDSYNASTTKIINVHVSRQTNWQSTAYGSNTDTYPIYRYIFTPVNGYSKTVFLSAGCHGNEAEGYWGLYRLMKMIYFEGYKYPTLRNLRDNVRFIIVPCWNPWGLEHYRRFNAFESDSYQAWKWLYSSNHTITVNGTAYTISEVGEADVIYDTITDYADYINLWLDLHTDPYAGRTTSSSDGIDDPRGYTQPYGFYGFAKNGSATKTRLCAVMEDFYNILKNEHSFTETWHLQGVNANATSGYSPWMMSLSFPAALVEVSTFMNNFTYASGTAGMMKLAQEYYGNCLAELLRE